MESKRTDPPVSQAQRGAMYAAAEGKSNLDIPKSVGKEFVEADPGGKLPERKRADYTNAPLRTQLEACAESVDRLGARMDEMEDCFADGSEEDRIRGAAKRERDEKERERGEREDTAGGIVKYGTVQRGGEYFIRVRAYDARGSFVGSDDNKAPHRTRESALRSAERAAREVNDRELDGRGRLQEE